MPTIYLIIVTIFWGLTFPFIKSSLSAVSSAEFVFLRFSFALFFFHIYVSILRKSFFRFYKDLPWKHLGAAIPLFLSYYPQTLALETISSARAAFLTGFQVIIVMLISLLLHPKKFSLREAFYILLSFVGIIIMTQPDLKQGFSFGDLMVLFCALNYAIYVLSLDYIGQKSDDILFSVYIQVLGVWILSLFVYLTSWPHPSFFELSFTDLNVLGSVLFCSFFATLITLLVQLKYQPIIGPRKASVIYTLEPFFAAIFGYFLLNEVMQFSELVGGSLIFISILLLSLKE